MNRTQIYDSDLETSAIGLCLNLWRERDLTWLLVKRDFIVRYRRSLIGMAWSLITPMSTSIVLYFVLSSVFKARLSGGSGYAAFLMAGVITINHLNQGGNGAGFAFYANQGVITKVKTELLMYPVVAVVGSFVTFLLGIVPLLFFILLEGRTIHLTVLLIPLIGVPTSVLILGLGVHVAVLSSRYQDIQGIMTVVYNILGYATPMIYPISVVHGTLRTLIQLNPLTEYVQLIRACVLDSSYLPKWYWCLYALIFTLLLFATSVVRLKQNKVRIVESL
jgi:ABC-type polysaccharide/polyol phosphate export permease